jgi:hypothetical protein
MIRAQFIPPRRISTFLLLCAISTALLTIGGCALSSGNGSSKSTETQVVPTSSATPTIPDQLTSLAEQASGHVLRDVQIKYQQPQENILVTGTVSGSIPRTPTQVGSSQENVKALCFRIERALWTSNFPVQSVTVTILGPVFDDYDDQITSWYGTAQLGTKAASRFDWTRMSADEAWTMFANTSLRENYGPFEGWGLTPVATASPSNHP